MSLSVKSRNLGIGFLFSAGMVVGLSPLDRAAAAPVYESSAHFQVGNHYPDLDGWHEEGVLYGPNQQYSVSSTLAQAAISGAAAFQGFDPNYDLATTTIGYAAQAQTSLSGGLKASASISGSNGFWNDVNAVYVNGDRSINPDGMPALYSAEGRSRVMDTLAVTGAAGLASVKFVFDIDGELMGTPGPNTLASISLIAAQTPSTDTQVNFYGLAGNYYDPLVSINQQVTSGFFNVVGGNVFLDMYLSASAAFLTPWGTDAASEGFADDGVASSNFFSTVKIAQILGFDADGRQISLTSVKGSDGTILPAMSLPVSAVPEPATWAMMITGFGLAGTALRRRNRAFVPA